jgi:uncharacterized protein (DUF1810 family)
MPASDDPHDLQRFLEAQESVIEDAKRELRTGRKRGHWMWFVFPQMAGLGRSERSRHYVSTRARRRKPTSTTRFWGRACGSVRGS